MKRSVSPESPGSYYAMNRIKRQPVDVELPLLSTSRQTVRDIASKFLAPQNDFRYEPIGIEQIRLLYLHPGYRADTIICDLKPVAITDLENHPYEALSYCWGVGEANKEIYIKAPEPQVTAQGRRPPQIHRIIRTVMSQKKFFVTENLEMALRRLRDENRTLTFWVDAVCIDQKNEIEKSQQVARLSEIFHQAVAVRVWLGENDDYSIEARRFIRKILNLKVLEDAVESPRAEPGSWFNLAQLMRRDWFTRRWVVQELALAREAILHIGDKQIHWDDFAEAVALFAQEAGRIAKLFGNSQEFLLNPRYLGDVRASGAFSIVHITNNLLRWVGDSQVERLIRLENLVAELLIFEARDPRDTIFAMLSIAKDIPRSLSLTTSPTQIPTYNIPATNPRLNADYSQNTLEVFKNFVAFCTLSGSLDIICRHWAPNQLPIRLRPQDYVRRQQDPNFFPTPQVIELPSWIPLLVDSAFGPPTEAVSGSRRAADDLVGEPGRPTYDAAKGTKATVWFGEVEASGENAFGGFYLFQSYQHALT
jgi:Heterokaryon incompatibility protein (HET)